MPQGLLAHIFNQAHYIARKAIRSLNRFKCFSEAYLETSHYRHFKPLLAIFRKVLLEIVEWLRWANGFPNSPPQHGDRCLQKRSQRTVEVVYCGINLVHFFGLGRVSEIGPPSVDRLRKGNANI